MTIEIESNNITFSNTNTIISDNQGITVSKGLDYLKNKVHNVDVNNGIVNIDLTKSQYFHIIATENMSTLNFINFLPYRSGCIIIKNASSLTHNTTFNTNVIWQHNSSQTLSGTVGSYIILEYKTTDADILLHYCCCTN